MQLLGLIWHWLTTSRYTRHLETENAALREENAKQSSYLMRLCGFTPPEQHLAAMEAAAEQPAILAENTTTTAVAPAVRINRFQSAKQQARAAFIATCKAQGIKLPKEIANGR